MKKSKQSSLKGLFVELTAEEVELTDAETESIIGGYTDPWKIMYNLPRGAEFEMLYPNDDSHPPIPPRP
jgi:hypothetical protein